MGFLDLHEVIPPLHQTALIYFAAHSEHIQGYDIGYNSSWLAAALIYFLTVAKYLNAHTHTHRHALSTHRPVHPRIYCIIKLFKSVSELVI